MVLASLPVRFMYNFRANAFLHQAFTLSCLFIQVLSIMYVKNIKSGIFTQNLRTRVALSTKAKGSTLAVPLSGRFYCRSYLNHL